MVYRLTKFPLVKHLTRSMFIQNNSYKNEQEKKTQCLIQDVMPYISIYIQVCVYKRKMDRC